MILTQGEKMVWAAAFVKGKSLVDAGKAVQAMRALEHLATEGLDVGGDNTDLQMLRSMLGYGIKKRESL